MSIGVSSADSTSAGLHALAALSLDLRKWVKAKGVPPQDRQDVAQEVMRQALESFQTFDPARPLRGWLYGIFVRVVADYFASRVRHRVASKEAGGATTVNPEQQLLREQIDCFVRLILDGLDKDRRAVLVACDIDGLTDIEAACAFDISRNTVRSRLGRARADFRRAMEKRGLTDLRPVLLPLSAEALFPRDGAGHARAVRSFLSGGVAGGVLVFLLLRGPAPPQREDSMPVAAHASDELIGAAAAAALAAQETPPLAAEPTDPAPSPKPQPVANGFATRMPVKMQLAHAYARQAMLAAEHGDARGAKEAFGRYLAVAPEDPFKLRSAFAGYLSSSPTK